MWRACRAGQLLAAYANGKSELGIRSSLNFVFEEDYQVPQELRDELRETSFEVGIHDLKHDGCAS
jgi:hypothetical protein